MRPFKKSSWIKSYNKTSIASSTIVLPSTGKNHFNSKKVLLSPLLIRFSNFSFEHILQTNLDFEWYWGWSHFNPFISFKFPQGGPLLHRVIAPFIKLPRAHRARCFTFFDDQGALEGFANTLPGCRYHKCTDRSNDLAVKGRTANCHGFVR